MDEDQFENDIQKESIASKVKDDFESGIRSVVNGTPSFYVNCKKYDGNWQEEKEFTEFLKTQL